MAINNCLFMAGFQTVLIGIKESVWKGLDLLTKKKVGGAHFRSSNLTLATVIIAKESMEVKSQKIRNGLGIELVGELAAFTGAPSPVPSSYRYSFSARRRSRSASRRAMVSRLSWRRLPRTNASSTLAIFLRRYMRRGTSVQPRSFSLL